MTTNAGFTVRRLGAGDGASYRELRLQGLRIDPQAFEASWEAEAAQPPSWFLARLADHAVFGGWVGSALSGVAGLLVPRAAKIKHKGHLWGVFVQPGARGSGLATALVERVIDHARSVVEELRVSVVATNAPAVRLYVAAGFRQYGLEPRAMKVADRFCDELLMALSLGEAPSGGSVRTDDARKLPVVDEG